MLHVCLYLMSGRNSTLLYFVEKLYNKVYCCSELDNSPMGLNSSASCSQKDSLIGQ